MTGYGAGLVPTGKQVSAPRMSGRMSIARVPELSVKILGSDGASGQR